jgi:hypothetical protein
MKSVNAVLFFVLFLPSFAIAATTSGTVTHDAAGKTITMADGEKNLVLRLNYDGRCMLDQVLVRGREVVPSATGVCSGIKVAGQWYTTRSVPTPKVTVEGNTVSVEDIHLQGGGVEVDERWAFVAHGDEILWMISRDCSIGTLEDEYFPGFDFTDRSWTGALLGTGGVAWFKLFDTPVASYGVHTGPVTFWSKESDSCLRILPRVYDGRHIAVRFSRHPHGVISCNYTVTNREDEVSPKYGKSRFLRDRQDVWAAFPIARSTRPLVIALSAPKYSAAYDRGTLRGIDGGAVREIANTIARLGAIDANIHGSNGWYSGYAVLQEQWIAQLGLLIDDPYYFQSYSDTLDYQRDHAVGRDGRVKPRWFYDAGDAMPGSYDAFGFYECQWGWMLDSQPCFVANVAEQFDFNGDLAWVRRHKATCEKALDYMLRRDSNGNGLVEVMTDSLKEKKGSDWADIVWAAFENGLVNAQMYNALTAWADVEEQLCDSAMAAKYRKAAAKLKETFNRPIAEGGLWDPDHRCYVHWRDKDGSIHGTNLFTPVNFLAIACGLCDDLARRAAILDQIEAQVQREKLFFWPLCMSSYQPEEGGGGPFPTYENGDIFLAWGELGIRAYVQHRPEVAVRIVENVIDKYRHDGLAFQRYLRKSQTGEGGDILSNMASPIVGLYRDIYGIQPKWNRLRLDPHITPELSGTQLKYWLRGQDYVIDLKTDDYGITVDKFTLRDKKAFAVDAKQNTLRYFRAAAKTPSMTLVRSNAEPLAILIETWPVDHTGARKWIELCSQAATDVRHVVADLPPRTRWELSRNGAPAESLQSDDEGRVVFTRFVSPWTAVFFDLTPASR